VFSVHVSLDVKQVETEKTTLFPDDVSGFWNSELGTDERRLFKAGVSGGTTIIATLRFWSAGLLKTACTDFAAVRYSSLVLPPGPQFAKDL